LNETRHRLAHLGNFGEHKWGISVSAIKVTVAGNTGSCNQQGTLTVAGIPGVLVAVTGNFEAAVKVPGGTLPTDYKLVLSVDCYGKPQQDTAALRVENEAPVAVDDTATTTQDTPAQLTVTATDPDGDDGYPTSVRLADPPANGKATVTPKIDSSTKPDGTKPDGTKPDGSIDIIIDYTPKQGVR
jgi:hypothetical protein